MSRRLPTRQVSALVLFLGGCFLLQLGLRLKLDDPLGSHAAVLGIGWLAVLVSAFVVRKLGKLTFVLVPLVWFLASILNIAFIQPAASVSRTLTMPAECRGASDYWDEVEAYSANMNSRSDLVFSDTIESQREFDILMRAAEQDVAMLEEMVPPAAARPFHEKWIELSYGWMGVYEAYWNGDFDRSMAFDLQEVDDELEARQLEFARKCGKYADDLGTQYMLTRTQHMFT